MKCALVVEDSPTIRLACREALESLGFEVLEAGNGLGAIVLCREPRDLDVVLLDLQMPVMDGFQFLEAFSRLSKAPGIPVLVCATDITPDGLRQALAAGARDLLPKPFTREQLRDKLIELGVLP